MPGARPEAGRDVGECEDQQSHAELDQDRHEEETREVDEADDVDGKLGDDQEDPGHQLEECAGGQKSPANNIIVMTIMIVIIQTYLDSNLNFCLERVW